VIYESQNVRDQREYLRATHQQLVESISNLVVNLKDDLGTDRSRELARIQVLDQQLWSKYDHLEKFVKPLIADEEKLSRLEYESKSGELGLSKASRKLVKTLQPFIRDGLDEVSAERDYSDSARSELQAKSEVAPAMHPKQEEYYSCLAIEEMMVERWALLKEEYESESVSRGLLQDQGVELAISDEEFESQHRTELLQAVQDCDSAAERVEAARKECVDLGLHVDVVVERPIEVDEMSASDSGLQSENSPTMSGSCTDDLALSQTDGLRDHLSKGLFTADNDLAIPHFSLDGDSGRTPPGKANDIGHWIEHTQNQALEDHLEHSERPSLVDADCRNNADTWDCGAYIPPEPASQEQEPKECCEHNSTLRSVGDESQESGLLTQESILPQHDATLTSDKHPVSEVSKTRRMNAQDMDRTNPILS
jgi:hypothetical protein